MWHDHMIICFMWWVIDEFWGLQLPEVGSLWSSPSETAITVGVLGMHRLLPGRSSKPDLGCSEPGEVVEDVPMSCFRLMRGSPSLPTFRLIRSQSLWQQLGKHAVNPIHGETGRCIFAFSLCNKSGEGSFRKCLCSCWKTGWVFFPFVYYVSVGLMNTELIHYQNQMIWGSMSCLAALKVWTISLDPWFCCWN